MYDIEETGGARIGMMNATWPFAKLLVNKNELRLNASIIGNLSFTPPDIISIEPYTSIPLLGRGIRIYHNVESYSPKVIFWTFSDPGVLIMRIKQTGFINNTVVPSNNLKEQIGAIRQKSVFPIRIPATIIIVVVWNLLFLHDEFGLLTGKSNIPQFGIGVQLALAMVFLTCILTLISNSFRSLILKADRDIKEIKSFIYFLMFVTGIMLLIVSLTKG